MTDRDDADTAADGALATPHDRLLLDAMLGKLATYLRMCGYNAAFALDRGVEADDRLRRLAVVESRRLVTRDTALARRARGDDGPSPTLLEAHAVTDQLAQLAAAGYELTLSARPARCGACNGRLTRADDADDADGADSVDDADGAADANDAATTRPEYVPADQSPVWRCLDCGQWFWKGGHWEQVADTLAGVTPDNPDP